MDSSIHVGEISRQPLAQFEVNLNVGNPGMCKSFVVNIARLRQGLVSCKRDKHCVARLVALVAQAGRCFAGNLIVVLFSGGWVERRGGGVGGIFRGRMWTTDILSPD